MQQVAGESITSDPNTQQLQNLWKDVANISYSKEDAIIEELRKNSEEKFQTLTDIITTEIKYSQEQQEKLENL